MQTIQHSLLAAGLLAASTAASAAINIDTVQVGNSGNANDSTGFGGVSYAYHIGTHEVTNGQYASFLNGAAFTDTHSLYNANMSSNTHGGINRSGSSGSYTYSVKSGFENKPVNFVNFWDAARFTNWLTSGDTETGVYNLGGTTNPDNSSVTRDATAWAAGGVAVASENEWYKAAYYDGNGAYTLYPTQSDSIPTTADANFNGGTVTDVGLYAAAGSHYGTFDQGGNVFEFNDTIVFGVLRGLRGGSFADVDSSAMRSVVRNYSDPASEEGHFIGFRVSSLTPIPEPSAYAAILGGLGLSLALMRRKGRGTL